jgi:hypothetical protein
MIPKVKISQFGKTYRIYIDGVRTPIDTLLKLVNAPSNAIRLALSRETREEVIRDYVIKAREGVQWRCHVFWKGDVYQLLTKVMDVVDIHSAGASIRMRNWMLGGSTEELYAPKTKGKKPSTEKKEGKVGSWEGLSNESRSSKLKEIR